MIMQGPPFFKRTTSPFWNCSMCCLPPAASHSLPLQELLACLRRACAHTRATHAWHIGKARDIPSRRRCLPQGMDHCEGQQQSAVVQTSTILAGRLVPTAQRLIVGKSGQERQKCLYHHGRVMAPLPALVEAIALLQTLRS